MRRIGDLHIWCIIALHISWACLMAGSKAADFTTPMAGLTQSGLSRTLVIVLLYVASTAAVASVLEWVGPRLQVAFLVPQQFLLTLTIFGVLKAVNQGAYADGVERPWEFILGDQLPMLLLAVPHTLVFFIRWREQARQWKA